MNETEETEKKQKTIEDSAAPEHEVAEEGVTLAHPEVVQQRLRHVAGVFEEAGEAGEHLHDLQRGEVVGLLHVLDTCGQTFLLCEETEERKMKVIENIHRGSLSSRERFVVSHLQLCQKVQLFMKRKRWRFLFESKRLKFSSSGR